MSQHIHRIPKALAQDGAGGRHRREDTSDEQKILPTIPELQAPMKRRLSPTQQTEERNVDQKMRLMIHDLSQEELSQRW